MNICGVEPIAADLGVPDSLLLTPGKPDKSQLALRMLSPDAGRMPPVG